MPNSTQYTSVSLFKFRPLVYKLGLLNLICCFILFIIGFSSSHWISFEYKADDEDEHMTNSLIRQHDISYRHAGLWTAPCLSSGTACNTGILVAQIAFSFHLAGYVISLAVAAYENCKKVDPVSYHSRILELCLFITGILGTAGIAVFVVWYSTSIPHDGFKWSLAPISLSLVGIFTTFFLLLCGNRKQVVSTQGTVIIRPQQCGITYYNDGTSCSAILVQNYQPPQPGNPLQQAPQNQPLLPPQPYFYPTHSHQFNAPPAYSLPPAYPLSPPQPQSFVYPNYQEHPHEGGNEASAPPYEEMLPHKS